MKMPRSTIRTRLFRPAVVVLLAVPVAVASSMLPDRHVAPVRDALAQTTRPAQRWIASWRAAAVLPRRGENYQGPDEASASSELAEARQQIAHLQSQLRRLDAIAGASNRSDSARGGPIMQSDLIPVRFVGQQARSFLQRRRLLDTGDANPGALEPGAIVLSGHRQLLDIGTGDGNESGRLVLAGHMVLGKVDHVGRAASTMQPIFADGYRDLVRIFHDGGPLGDAGIPGVLVGTGDSTCRVQRIPLTEPVAVGDVVCSAAAEGIAAGWPLCGTIVRVEQAAGASHWNVWMQPAARAERFDRAAVLRTQAVPARMATATRRAVDRPDESGYAPGGATGSEASSNRPR